MLVKMIEWKSHSYSEMDLNTRVITYVDGLIENHTLILHFLA